MSDWSRPRTAAWVCIGVAAAVSACGGGGDDLAVTASALPTYQPAGPSSAAATAPPTTPPPATVAPSSPVSEVPAPVREVPSALELQMPAIRVTAPVVEVGVTDDLVLEIPEDPAIVGRWTDGARPGDGTGSIVLAGHVDYQGVQGALAPLANLKPGDEAVLDSTAGPARYVTDRVDVLSKQALPWEEIFQFDVPERLVVITCGGQFNRSTGHYESNVIAYLRRV